MGVGVGSNVRRLNVRASEMIGEDARGRQMSMFDRRNSWSQWPMLKGGSEGDGWLVIMTDESAASACLRAYRVDVWISASTYGWGIGL